MLPRVNHNPAIRFDRVCKTLGSTVALDNFCLDVAEGEFLTIIGASGCGKTTLLKMVISLLKPDSGHIRLWGTDSKEIDIIQLRRRVGYVIQGSALFPHLNVHENICYVPRLRGKPAKDELDGLVRRLLVLVGLEEDVADRYPCELSGGQQQRAGIARALAAEPKMMLMDEPFSAVDELTRANLQNEILRIQRELGLTVLFVTHDIGESCKLGSRMLVMHQGRNLQNGTPDEIRRAPADEHVEKLLGLN